MVLSSQYIMLYLFCTEVAVLCGSIKSILFIFFGSLFTIHYKKGPLFTNHYTPSRPSVMLDLFHTEVVVLCSSIKSIHYVIFVSYESVCLILFFKSQSTIFQLCRDGSSLVEPELSNAKCVLLKNTTQCVCEARTRGPSVSSQALYH